MRELAVLLLQERKNSRVCFKCFVNEKWCSNAYVGGLLIEIKLKLIGETVFWLKLNESLMCSKLLQ